MDHIALCYNSPSSTTATLWSGIYMTKSPGKVEEMTPAPRPPPPQKVKLFNELWVGVQFKYIHDGRVERVCMQIRVHFGGSVQRERENFEKTKPSDESRRCVWVVIGQPQPGLPHLPLWCLGRFSTHCWSALLRATGTHAKGRKTDAGLPLHYTLRHRAQQ